MSNNNILQESDDDLFSSPPDIKHKDISMMNDDIDTTGGIKKYIPILPNNSALPPSTIPSNNSVGTSSSTSPYKKILSFPNDLWDGFEILSKRTEIGIDNLKDLLEFFKRRANIEEKYAKTVTDYFSKFKLKDENDTFQRGIGVITKLNEAESTIHKTFSQNLLNNIIHPFQALVKEMENRRKTLITEGQKLRNELKDSIDDLKKAQQKYEKHCKETEAAKIELISFNETDPNSIKMNAIEKKISLKEGNAIIAEEEYKQQIKITNDFVTNQYHIRMIENLVEFEQFEAMRLQFMKSNIKNYIGVMMEVPSSMESEINGHLGGTLQIDSVDPENDLQHFIRNNTTQKKLLAPFQFEPYMDSKLIQLNQQEVNNNNNSLNNDSNNNSTPPISNQENDENQSSPSSPTLPSTKTLKENIFGFFNNAKNNLNNLKSSTNAFNSFTSVGGALNSSSSNVLFQQQQQQQQQHNNNNNDDVPLSSSSKVPIITSVSKFGVYGVELEELMDQQKKEWPTLEVPLVLMGFAQSLLKLNALETEDIFATLPPISLIQKEKLKVDQSGQLDHVTEVHLVATLFKQWLRDLPNPLISFAIYDEVLETPENAWSIIESNSPILHCKVLHYIIDFLAEFIEPDFVAISKCTITQISQAFSPVLLRSPTSTTNNNHIAENKVIESLILESFEKKKLTTTKFQQISNNNNNIVDSPVTSNIEYSPLVSESSTSFSPTTFISTPLSLNSMTNIINNSNNISQNEEPPRNFSTISFGSNNDDRYSTDDELSKEFVEC